MIKLMLLWTGFAAYVCFGINILRGTSVPLDEKLFLIISVILSAYFLYFG
jgi:hypothetical protein